MLETDLWGGFLEDVTSFYHFLHHFVLQLSILFLRQLNGFK